MMAFEGMGANPFEERGPLEEEKEGPTDVELQEIEAQLSQWEGLRKGPLGNVIRALIGPLKMRQAETAIATTADLFRAGFLDVRCHDVIRAEARGAYAVWNMILTEPQRLLARKQELEKETEAKNKE